MSQRKINLTLLILIICLAAAAPLAACAQQPTATSVVVADATIDISGIEPVSSDEPVTVGDITWEVLEVTEHGESLKPQTGPEIQSVRGKFFSVAFSVRNDSGETETLYDLNVVDSQGRVFNLCLPAFEFFSEEDICALVDLNPGFQGEFVAPFDVAPDSEGLLLQVTNLNRDEPLMEYIDLGI